MTRAADDVGAGRNRTAYAVSVGDRQYHVEVHDSHLLVDGQRMDFELTSLNGNGLHLFRQGVRSTEMYFRTVGDGTWEVCVQGQAVTAQVDTADPAAQRRRARRTEACEVAGDVTAPMPGLVVDVQVSPGQAVAQGDVLLVQESMKMQMLLRAPFGGRVGSVCVTRGEHVDKGALLVRLTEERAAQKQPLGSGALVSGLGGGEQ